MKKFVLILGFFCINIALASKVTSTANTSGSEPFPTSGPVIFTEGELLSLKKLAEAEKLSEYTGNEGSAPKGMAISTLDLTLEETRTGPASYVFWSQTLRSSFYYQIRLTGKWTLQTEPPPFLNIPYSSENNPNGYKGMFKVGYNFHLTPHMQITPFLRVEAGKNMTLVYADKEGDYIHSTNYAILSGFKMVFKLESVFSPYFELFGGIAPISLTGNLIEGPTPNKQIKGFVQGIVVVNEFGFAYKIAKNQAVIPYIAFVYDNKQPNELAATPYSKGGFNILQLTTSEQVYGIKYNYFW